MNRLLSSVSIAALLTLGPAVLPARAQSDDDKDSNRETGPVMPSRFGLGGVRSKAPRPIGSGSSISAGVSSGYPIFTRPHRDDDCDSPNIVDPWDPRCGYSWYRYRYGGVPYYYSGSWVVGSVGAGNYGQLDSAAPGTDQQVMTDEELARRAYEDAVDPDKATPWERAVEWTRRGEWDQAETAAREHVSANNDDAQAIRLLGVIRVAQKELDEGVALIRLAYREHPELASAPLEPGGFAEGEVTLRELVRLAVPYAHKEGTASGWLTVAVLMQGEGRNALAGKMLERAESAGLEDEVLKQLRTSLN